MLLGGWAGTGVMALMAQLMPISDPGNVPFYVAIASVLVGQGAWSWITGFLMHILASFIIATIFGIVVTRVPSFKIDTIRHALGVGILAGIAVWGVLYLPLMTLLVPYGLNNSWLLAGSFFAHVVFGITMGGMALALLPRTGPGWATGG